MIALLGSWLLTGRSAVTMSASTAPASTEDNWFGSPTITSLVLGRSADSSARIRLSETIDISSTISTS